MDELDWQNNFHHIKDRGQYLLKSEKWADCRFLVGTAPNQRIIAGHKLILAMASPVFERMFYGNLPDKSDPIIIPDVQPDAFQAMLEYIYSDNINITTFDKACELCYVAKKYMLPYVVERCTHFLWADLSPINACRAYEFGKLFDEARLMQTSMDIISAHTRQVLEDPSFLDIEVSTLMAILDQDHLNIDSELDLFNGLVKYATDRGMFSENAALTKQSKHMSVDNNAVYDMQQQQDVPIDLGTVEEIKMEPDVALMMQHHQDDEVNYDADNSAAHVVDDVVVVDSDASGADADVHVAASTSSINSLMEAQRMIIDEATLRQAVKKIRFLTLSPQQFAEGPARSKLLQQNEALAILIKISSPAINDLPMPEGFCSSLRTRSFFEQRNQQNLSSYRNSVNLNNTPVNYSADAQPVVNSTATVLNLPLMPNIHDPDGDATTNDTRRSYCVRTANQKFDYRNTSVTDCGVTFLVDTNIWITGVQVPTQVLCGELMHSAGFSDRYTELLYAHIQDMQGSRLTYTHCTSRVRYDSLLEISFDRPVYIYKHQTYKVFVVFNKVGWYPMSTCVPDVTCNFVKFMFNVGNPSESVRDGLIRAIVFSLPQEFSRNISD